MTLLILFLQTEDTWVTQAGYLTTLLPNRATDSLNHPTTPPTTPKSPSTRITSAPVRFVLCNHSQVLCVSAGLDQEVIALHKIGAKDVTTDKLVDSPLFLSRVDPPLLVDVFRYVQFGARHAFGWGVVSQRYAREMQRTVWVNGVVWWRWRNVATRRSERLSNCFENQNLREQ